MDRYAYTFNNPINYTDPSGHDPWWNDYDFYYANLLVYINAGINQQSPVFYRGVGWRLAGDNTGIGPAKVSDNQMEAEYGDPASGDPKDPRGFGLGLRKPGDRFPEQYDTDTAKIAMGRRISIRMEACQIYGCSATDKVIVAALAANESISFKEIMLAFKNKDYFSADGSFDWESYLSGNESKDYEFIKKKLIEPFINAIDPEGRDPNVDWDYIEGLIQ